MFTITKPMGHGALPQAPDGIYQAVVVDIIDQGWHRNFTSGKEQEKLSLVLQLSLRDENAKRYMISEWLTKSFFQKATLAKRIVEITGQSYEALSENFDLDSLIGRNVRVRVIQGPNKNGEIRAKMVSIEPWTGDPRGETMQCENYIRKCDRPALATGDGFQSSPGSQGNGNSIPTAFPPYQGQRDVGRSPAPESTDENALPGTDPYDDYNPSGNS